MMTFAIFGVLIFFIMVGLPIAVSMGLTAVIFFVVLGETDVLCMVPARMYSSTTGFPLLAIPFFILVGNLMNTGGMTNRIFRFAQCLVGHIKGGLGHVNVVNSMIFAGMSGAAVADAAGIGMVEMEVLTGASVLLLQLPLRPLVLLFLRASLLSSLGVLRVPRSADFSWAASSLASSWALG